jgi:Cytochrome b5-like Heme/Steroid binding domain
VYGRVAGDTAAAYLLQNAQSASDKAAGRLGAIAGHLLETKIIVDPQSSKVNLEFSWKGDSSSAGQKADFYGGANATHATTPSTTSAAKEEKTAAAEPAKPKAEEKGEAKKTGGEYTMEEVAKHNTQGDCWVVVNGEVLDVTKVIISFHLPKLRYYEGIDC